MKFFYVSNARIPTEKAHGLQITKTCAALSMKGAEVELLIPDRKNPLGDDIFFFYKIREFFPVQRLFCFDLLRFGVAEKVAFFIQTVSFVLSVLAFMQSRYKDHVIYGRDEFVLAPLSLFFGNVFWETHTGSNNLFSRILQKRAKGIVCITEGLADFYASNGVSRERLSVAGDAVDMETYDSINRDKGQLRESLSLPKDASLVTYSGSLGLYSWKGVDVFLDSLGHIKNTQVIFMLVGGSKEDIEKLRSLYDDKRILFVGRVDPEKVAKYLVVSDVLVLPNKKGDVVSEKYTSPMKLFEYMASGVPMVASDLPSIREVISEETGYMVEPNDPKDLAHKIEMAVGDRLSAEARAGRAVGLARKHSWPARAESIIRFVEKEI